MRRLQVFISIMVMAFLLAGCGGVSSGGIPPTGATPTGSGLPTLIPLPTATQPPTSAPQIMPTVTPPSTETPGSVPGEAGSKTVTLDQNGQTINLAVGQSFLLKLGEQYDWTVTVADPAVISREVNVTVIRGAQGIYLAHERGRTTLSASGDPLCAQDTPPCKMPSILFKVEVVVQ